VGHRQDRPAPSASVLKAMLLVAYLQRGAVREQPLDRGQRRLLAPMVRWSSNVAASRVLGVIGLARMQQAAARWGMRRFRLGDPWGHSAITAREQARFWLHLDGRVPPRHRVYALRLLRTVVPAQRWGVARVTPRGWTLHFKGGWGSGSGAVDHQTALLTRGTSGCRWRSSPPRRGPTATAGRRCAASRRGSPAGSPRPSGSAEPGASRRSSRR
jgi:hypothetical protein